MFLNVISVQILQKPFEVFSSKSGSYNFKVSFQFVIFCILCTLSQTIESYCHLL